MTNEELKKKIVDVITNIEWTDIFGIRHGGTADGLNNAIADALIAAEIGDMKEAELRAEVAESELERYTGLIKPLEDENTRLKHRAEVAERALKSALNDDTCYFCNMNAPCEVGRDWGSSECIKSLLQQAEKELAEEGKDD